LVHNDSRIGEDGTWVEGIYNRKPGENGFNSSWVGKTWTEITAVPFPYNIRNAPDSFPCTVFYRDTSNDETELTLLGQYVFMDDKKSDHVYGERSIYKIDDITDPFCLK
jgi:hypothetical protein